MTKSKLKKPGIAVIIPTYNRMGMISRAVDSVLAQTLPVSEICVVDDGSIDNSADFIQERYPQVNYIYQANLGVSAARNRGVENTSSEWLAFLDSDDEWLPEKLQIQFSSLAENPEYRLVHCDEMWLRDGERINPRPRHKKKGGDIFKDCLNLCVMAPSAVVMQRDLFLESGGFDIHLPACEDYALWLKICSQHPVLYVDQILLNRYAGHEGQLSAKHWGMDRFRVQALDQLLRSDLLSDEQYIAARRVLAEKCNILKLGAEKRNKTSMARLYADILDMHPICRKSVVDE